jgi:hypothetical protein
MRRNGAAKKHVNTPEEDAEAQRKEIEASATGMLRTACDILPVTGQTLIVYCICWIWIGFCLFYIALFGLYQPAAVTTAVVVTFFTAQAMTLFLTQPLVLLAGLVFQLAVAPAWAPYVLWIPVVGPIVAGQGAQAMAAGSGATALTGRLENLTLVRAAGAASLLPPDSALVAYGAAAVLGAAMGGAGRAIAKVAARATRLKKRAEADKAANAAAGEAGGHQLSDGLSDLTVAERHELVVRRYLVAQLKAAQAEFRKRHGARKASVVSAVAFAKSDKAPGGGSWVASSVEKAVLPPPPDSPPPDSPPPDSPLDSPPPSPRANSPGADRALFRPVAVGRRPVAATAVVVVRNPLREAP